MYIIIYVLSNEDVRLVISEEECTHKLGEILIFNDDEEYAVIKVEQHPHTDYEFIEYKIYLSYVQKVGESHGLH